MLLTFSLMFNVISLKELCYDTFTEPCINVCKMKVYKNRFIIFVILCLYQITYSLFFIRNTLSSVIL